MIGRPTWVEIDRLALRWNLRQVKKLVGAQTGILAVVKANAYGHGAVACAKVLVENGAHSLGVASVEEATELRRAGIKLPLVIFGISQKNEVDQIIRLQLQPTVVDLRFAKMLSMAAQKKHRNVKVHVKLDTGMGRIGIPVDQSQAFAKRLKSFSGIQPKGIFTHFSNADGKDQRLLKQQINDFHKGLMAFRKAGYTNFISHAANSAAVMESPQAHFDVVRPGLMLYGIYPSKRFLKKAVLKPVLTWKTRIVQLKQVPKGTGLSYGHTFTTRKNSMIATLPVGYADGFSRQLSNNSSVLVKGKNCPVVGRVCMDMCLIDVSAVRGAKTGDEVVLIGQQSGRHLTADDMAARLDTISYEVLCAIGQRVPRIMKGD